MGALPKRKISKQRKNNRRSHDSLLGPSLSLCPNCNKQKLSHRVCPFCGTYKGVQVIKAE